MKTNKLKTLGAIIAIATTALFSGCSSKKANDLDGVIVKTEDGRYFEIEANIGDTVFLKEINFEDQPKKF